MTTYYPAPYGEYTTVQLAPTDTIDPATACTNGQMYFDDSVGTFYDCVGSVWQQRASGVPRGAILMWSGAETAIPSGWVLCNGANGTPDLRNRFIVGSGTGSSYAVAATGGEASHTLSTAEMPSHNHTGSTNSGGTHTHGYRDHIWGSAANGTTAAPYARGTSPNTTDTGGNHTHGISSSGSGAAHENRPPYYALCYIMKT